MIEKHRSTTVRQLAHARIVHFLIRSLVGTMYRIGRLFRFLLGRRIIGDSERIEVLLTGAFHCEEWIMAFMRPLVAAGRCKNVVLVTTFPVTEVPGLTVIYPPDWMRHIAGEAPARLVMFAWQALRRQPQLVGGFHISINALFAELVASLVGARSIYFCVGGPMEILDGGLWGESKTFGKLRQADKVVEEKILRSVREFDFVVSMGSKAADWFIDHGINPDRIRSMTGAIDTSRFSAPKSWRPVDLIFVGRLVPIKDLPLLLETVRTLVDLGRLVRLRIIGRGLLEEEVRQRIAELRLGDHVELAGFVPDVIAELKRAKCFVLTSKSEGVSLALIEAMLAGAVPIVADVGDLADLVTNGENGYRVDSRDPANFANCINDLIADAGILSAQSEAAYNTGLRYGIDNVAEKWNTLLSDIPDRQ